MSARRAPRLYLTAGLAAGAEVELDPGQGHYLRAVLRLAPGAAVTAFNASEGEWRCRIMAADRNRTRLTIEVRLREPEPEGDLWLLFAPLKRARLDWLIEKATELGVAALLPVWTMRTQAERVNLDRLQAHAIEAAEQSERLSVPKLRAPEPLERVLTGWPVERRLMVCDESGAGEPIAQAAGRLATGPLALLIGPEGGFDDRELDAIGKLPIVTRVGLGPRVLRAETAALAAVAVVQAIAGDWRRVRAR